MKTPLSPHHENPPRGWMWLSSILILCAAVILLGAALGAGFSNRVVSSPLLIMVLIALGTAIGLHARFLILARREHRETARTLDATEREFRSIFDNALDGILVLDDRGFCLEANPAAQALLGVRREELIGGPVGKFHAEGSKQAGNAFLKQNCQQCETQLVRKDGATIFVEYTAKANYLPGKHVAILRDISERKRVETALQESEQRFRQMATHIGEIFWMVDAVTKQVIYVNRAYENITGRSCQTLRENPTSYQELIHPEDRIRVLARLDYTVASGQFDEEFRIVRPDSTIRWVWVHGFPVRDSAGSVRRLVGTAQDISARKFAEVQIARNLALAESACAEADAFRKTTLALTENLSMDYVLDTLLESLLKLIPCESARVLLVEAETRLFVAREVQNCETGHRIPKSPPTLDARDSRFLLQVLAAKSSLLIPNTIAETDWNAFKGFSHLQSWLCVPLVASQQVLGLLSLGDTHAQAFTQEHLRLAKSLAIPAAVAIQNARLYERAEIYGAELEDRLADLEMTQQALRLSEEGRTLSEERFTKVFRSSPIPFSITTLEEGRFVDVNDAFETRYGYSREQLIGRTASEVGVWDDPSERSRVVDEIREHGRVHDRITRLRRSSGEVIDTIVSAEAVDLDGRECLLAVSEDLPNLVKLAAPLSAKSAVAH